MTKNLLVQEWLDSRKGLLAVFGIYVVAQLLSLVFVGFGIQFVSNIFLVLSIALAVLLIPGVLILLGTNYWQSMYGNRGYFTFSIPVQGREIYAVKVLYSFAVALAAGLLLAISIPAIVVAVSLGNRRPIADSFEVIRSGLAMAGLPAHMWGLIAFSMVLQLFLVIVAAAAIMSIGAQGKYNSLGFGAPVIGAIIFYVANQIISLVASMFVPLGITISGPDTGQLVARGMFGELIASLQTGAEPTVLGLGSFIWAVIAGIIMWVWAVNAIEKHTSLR